MVLIRSHDALVRYVFGEPEQMAELLCSVLPAEIAAAIDWTTLTRVDGQFVDKTLQEQRTDMVFAARLRSATVLLHVLHEHKSKDQRATALQLGGYGMRLLERWHQDHPGAPLPLVMPIVLYHGSAPWRSPRRIDGLRSWQGCPGPLVRFLRPLQPEQAFLVVDLAAMTEAQLDALSLSAATGLTLRFLQFLREASIDEAARALLRWADLILQLAEHRHGKDVLSALFSWWLAGAPASSETLSTVMTKIQQENPQMRSLLDMVLDLGEERGLRALVAEQLEARFGALPDNLQERLAAADAESLQRWGRRLLTAADLAAVFAGD